VELVNGVEGNRAAEALQGDQKGDEGQDTVEVCEAVEVCQGGEDGNERQELVEPAKIFEAVETKQVLQSVLEPNINR